MKKNRNAFFQSNAQASYYYPTQQASIPMNGGMSYPMATESSSNFYQGPIMTPVAGNTDYMSELESRLAKIERQIARLDTRVTKLESEAQTNISDNSYNTNNTNMYMI